MNIDIHTKKPAAQAPQDFDLDNFDFKPITSGLGFHQPKASEVKPAFIETHIPKPVMPKKVQATGAVYQNDLSLFYGHSQQVNVQPTEQVKLSTSPQTRVAGRGERIAAYLLDLGVVAALLSLTLTAMARSMDMDLIEAWMTFPHDMTPLVLTLFCGFYLIYFSVFEKAASSTLGKSLFSLRVISSSDEMPNFSTLLMRSFLSLINFVSLGLFSWYDLQNKISHTKVIRLR